MFLLMFLLKHNSINYLTQKIKSQTLSESKSRLCCVNKSTLFANKNNHTKYLENKKLIRNTYIYIYLVAWDLNDLLTGKLEEFFFLCDIFF